MKVYYKAAENKDDAKSLYNSRKDYRKIYAHKTTSAMGARNDIRHIDLRSDFPLYGKVDFNGNPVYVLPENSMSPLGNESVLHCVNFVKDAFEDFQDHYSNAYERGMLEDVGSISTIKANSAYASPMIGYERGLTELKDFFLRDHVYPDPNSIEDVEDFMNKFKRELLKQCVQFPLTFSGYVLSANCTHNTTGLVVSLLGLPKGSDKAKLKMVASPYYNTYVAIAAKFGFRVDMNTPWNLVADLGSRHMLKYMRPYGLEDPRNYFKEYTTPSYEVDLKKLKELLYDAYYEFVTTIKVKKTTPKCLDGIASSKSAYFEKRPQHRPDVLDKMFPEVYWLDFYIEARYNELNFKTVSPKELEKAKEKIMITYNQRGIVPAMKFASKHFDGLNLEVYKLSETVPAGYASSRYLTDEEMSYGEDEEYSFRATESWMEDPFWASWATDDDDY